MCNKSGNDDTSINTNIFNINLRVQLKYAQYSINKEKAA